MASRLSDDEIRAVYDGGQQGLSIEAPLAMTPAGDVHAGGALAQVFDVVDLDRLADGEDAERRIQALPAQVVYRSLARTGLEDSLELLPLLSRDQVVRIFDYDVWREDRLAPLAVVKWLSLWREVGSEELFRRFRGLDEEYQVAFLSGMVEIFDEEEFERLPQAEQDSLTRLPCNTLFYRLTTDDPRIEEGVLALIEAALAGDVAYAYSLLNHAAYMPPNESEAALAQFRRSRLEEDGFVTLEESLQAFRPLDLAEWCRRWRGADQAGAATGASVVGVLEPRSPAGRTGSSMLATALATAAATMDAEDFSALARSYAHLGNTLCAASRVAPDDLAGQRRVLGLAQGFANLGLELAVGGDATQAVAVVCGEHPQRLFRAGIAAARRLGEAMVKSLAVAQAPKADDIARLFKLDRYGALLHTVDLALLPVLGFERAEMLKGLFNRFPVVPQAMRALGLDDGAEPATQRVVFAPVDSLARLAELASCCDAIAAILAIAGMVASDGLRPDQDVDQQLATAIARVLAGGVFGAAPLRRAELERLESLEAPAAQALVADLCAEIEERLRHQRRDWSASDAAGVTAAQSPIQVAMAAFSDIVMGVLAARERARQGAGSASGVAAWTGIVKLEEALDA